MSWRGHLQLRYRRDDHRTVAHDAHTGPLRVLAGLYPEGPGICHHILVHPPGGIAGGDRLEVDLDLGAETHATLTTPGANRFYRSAGEAAQQHVRARIGSGARLEWLPLESIVFPGARVENRLEMHLAPGAEMIGWDIVALGLPAAAQPFVQGSFRQSIEWQGHWLEQGCLDARDTLLLDSPLGLDGRRVIGTAWFAAADGFAPHRGALLRDSARDLAAEHPLIDSVGVTSPSDSMVVVRALATRVEPLMALFGAVWSRWRVEGWRLKAHTPRIWRT